MDKELLLAPRRPEADVEIPGVGTVRVRGLTRAEVNVINSHQEREGTKGFERYSVLYGMVDPRLTEDEVNHWFDNAVFGELQLVLKAILQLSGLMDGADKEAYKSLRDGSEPGVGVLPSDETGDDGSPAP